MKKIRIFLVLSCFVFLTGCSVGKPSKDVFAKLLSELYSQGVECDVFPFEDKEDEAPIYLASEWYKLQSGSETILCYFDESNRADYLQGMVDVSRWGKAYSYGLRFVLVYDGEDETILRALEKLSTEK